MIKVAQTSFQHFQETLLLEGFTLQHFYHVTAILWYDVKHQLLLNKLQKFL